VWWRGRAKGAPTGFPGASKRGIVASRGIATAGVPGLRLWAERRGAAPSVTRRGPRLIFLISDFRREKNQKIKATSACRARTIPAGYPRRPITHWFRCLSSLFWAKDCWPASGASSVCRCALGLVIAGISAAHSRGWVPRNRAAMIKSNMEGAQHAPTFR
jgi:hypothetical protein